MSRFEIEYKSSVINGFMSVRPKLLTDSRGSFHRFFCEVEFLKEIGISFDVKQINISHSKLKGTFRGFHSQNQPFSESKILTALKGRFLDLVVDINENSPSYLKHDVFEFSSALSNIVIVPSNCAHAILSLEDDSCAVYLSNNFYNAESEFGISPFDPAINLPHEIIEKINVISDKDKCWKNYINN